MNATDQAVKQSRLTKPFRSLRHVNYRWYWVSGWGMAAAQGIKELTLVWLVLDLTGSLAQLGLVVFMQGLPMSAVALFGGVLADRYDRRLLLIYSQLVTVLNLLVLAGLTLAGRVELWHIYVSSVLLGVTQAITMPARQSFIRNLVDREDTMNALALNNIQMHASRIVWPSVAGALISWVGIGSTLMVNGVAALVGVGALLFIRRVQVAPPGPRSSPLQELGDGLRYAWSTPQVAAVVIMAWAVSLLGLSYMRMAPAFAREELGMNAAQTGLFLAFFGIGSVTASILFMVIDVRQKNRLFIGVNLAIGLGVLAFVANPWYIGAFAFITLLGMGPSIHSLLANTIFQLTVPSQYLGRVSSLWGVAGGMISMSGLFIGVLGEAFGLRAAMGGAAAMLVLTITGLVVLWAPARKMLESEKGPVADRSGP